MKRLLLFLCVVAGFLAVAPAFAATPPTPTDVSFVTGRFEWTWSQGTGGMATEFRLYCGTTSANYYPVVPTLPVVAPVGVAPYPANVMYLRDTTLAPGTTYYCSLTAANSAGNSPPSSEVAPRTLSAPSGLTVK